jgi:hypothetical protein
MIKMKSDAKIWERWKEMPQYAIVAMSQNVTKIQKIQKIQQDFSPRNCHIMRIKMFEVTLITQ